MVKKKSTRSVQPKGKKTTTTSEGQGNEVRGKKDAPTIKVNESRGKKKAPTAQGNETTKKQSPKKRKERPIGYGVYNSSNGESFVKMPGTKRGKWIQPSSTRSVVTECGTQQSTTTTQKTSATTIPFTSDVVAASTSLAATTRTTRSASKTLGMRMGMATRVRSAKKN